MSERARSFMDCRECHLRGRHTKVEGCVLAPPPAEPQSRLVGTEWVKRGPQSALDDLNVETGDVWTSVDGVSWVRDADGDWWQACHPRKDAQAAYQVFMRMDDEQWSGLVRSLLLEGGVLEPAESQGFERAYDERRAL